MEIPLTGCPIGHYFFPELFSEVFATLDWPRKYQLGVSHHAWVAANGFVIQKPCYTIVSEKWGKKSSEKPEEKMKKHIHKL